MSWTNYICLGVLVFCCFNLYGQQTIRVIDSVTGKDQGYAWVKLLKNGYYPIDKSFGAWDPNYLDNLEEGAEFMDSDSLFVGLYNSQYLPVWHKLDVNSTDTLVIELKEDELLFDEFQPTYEETAVFPYGYDFYPRIITSLDSLPKDHQEMILTNLKKYVGEDLFDELRVFRIYALYSNQVKQSGLLRRYAPDQLIYHLTIIYQDFNLQIEGFAASMEISSDGFVYKNPELPNYQYISTFGLESIPTISKKQILEKMAKNPRFDPEMTSAEFSFSTRAQVFIWKVKESRIGPRGLTYVTETHFDASIGVQVAKFFDRLNIIYD